jgi:PAS domain S-box-containing protein
MSDQPLSELNRTVQPAETLQQSEAALRLIVDFVPDLLWRNDAQGCTTWYNQRWVDYTGQPLEQAYAAGWLQMIHPADRAQSLRNFEQALAECRPMRQVHRIRSASGTYRWFQIRTEPVYDKQGKVSQWIGAATDIHEQRLAEQKRITAVLEAQEEERRRIAESLHNGLGQLLYAAKLQISQLEATVASAAAHRLLAEAIKQTRELSHELTPNIILEFGLQVALHDICHNLSSATLRWHCTVHFETAQPVPLPLQVALYRLAQELAQNVVKHARASHATIEVETLPGWVVLRVEDNGQGFVVGTDTMGIGLKTLQHRVALLGGLVQLEAATRQGSQILIRLPLATSLGT